MTSNQIAFYKAKEEAKHYRRQDRENKRHNVKQEGLTYAELGIKDWANRANVELGYANAAINRSHYERSDYNTQVTNQLKTDQLMLDAIDMLGQPVTMWEGGGVKTKVSHIGFSDYYDPSKGYVSFQTTPISQQYLSAENLPKLLGGLGTVMRGVGGIIGLFKGQKGKGKK